MTKVSCVCGEPPVCLMQTGSAFILMSAFFGAAPSSATVPVTSPAVAGSTFSPEPDVVAGADVLPASLLPPPQAATDAASANPIPHNQTFRRRMDLIS